MITHVEKYNIKAAQGLIKAYDFVNRKVNGIQSKLQQRLLGQTIKYSHAVSDLKAGAGRGYFRLIVMSLDPETLAGA